MIGFKKNVIEKIWFKKHFKRFDLKIKNLTNKKRYDSNIKPFSTEKATYLKCWIKSLIDSKYLWKWKEIDFEKDLIEKIWFEKDLILKNFENLKKIDFENKIFPLVPSWR